MKKHIVLGLILALFGCEKNYEINTDGKVIWQPDPVAYINDGEVQLHWLNYSIFTYILRPYEIVAPDKFEIYVSQNDRENFHKWIEVKNEEEYSYTLAGLNNHQPVYIYVTSVKKGFERLISDTIMVVPAKKFRLWISLFKVTNIPSSVYQQGTKRIKLPT